MNFESLEIVAPSTQTISWNRNSELTEVRGWVFCLKLAAFGIISTIGIVFLNFSYLPFSVTGIFIMGAMFAHALELQHQCLHSTAFKNRNLNRIVGFLLGVPMLVSFSHYRFQHLKHHRDIGTPNDKEFFQREGEHDLAGINLAIHAFSLGRYVRVLSNFLKSWFPASIDNELSYRVQEDIKFEYRVLSLILLTAVGIVAFVDPIMVLKFWFVPALLVAEPIHFLIELPEHLGCQKQIKDNRLNTRTIMGSRFSFWYTNGNNFHVEHHSRPSLPIDRLPQTHEAINERLPTFEKSYVNFYIKALRGNFK
jgi:fatty acid desaturase